MLFSLFAQFFCKDHIIGGVAAIDEVYVPAKIFFRYLADHTHKRGDPAAAREKHQVAAMEQRIIGKCPGRTAALQFIAHTDIIKEIVRYKPVSHPANRDVIVGNLIGG